MSVNDYIIYIQLTCYIRNLYCYAQRIELVVVGAAVYDNLLISSKSDSGHK